MYRMFSHSSVMFEISGTNELFYCTIFVIAKLVVWIFILQQLLQAWTFFRVRFSLKVDWHLMSHRVWHFQARQLFVISVNIPEKPKNKNKKSKKIESICLSPVGVNTEHGSCKCSTCGQLKKLYVITVKKKQNKNNT